MGYNIRQANKSTVMNKLRQNPPLPIKVPKTVLKNGKYEIVIGDGEGQKYVSAISDVNILKLGYCCEEKGHIYPIFIKINGSWKDIYIGKDGMYEMQPETFKDVNIENSEEFTTNITITEVWVPADIDFTLDYVVSTT